MTKRKYQTDDERLAARRQNGLRSEEHTSELQSLTNLVCRLLLDTGTCLFSILSLHDALPICRFIFQAANALRRLILFCQRAADVSVSFEQIESSDGLTRN